MPHDQKKGNSTRSPRSIGFTALLFMTFLIVSGCASINSEETNMHESTRQKHTLSTFNPAFAHTVFFWLKNPDKPEDRAAFETSLRAFLNNSNHALTGFIGTPPAASREVVDGSFTYSLIVSFESAEAQAAYQKEEAHERFIKESSDLWEKVIVYDSIGLMGDKERD